MLRKLVLSGCTLLVAGAVTIATPAFSWARGSGGHFGGGHVGGVGHFGGAPYGGAHIGGYRGAFYNRGYYGNRFYYGGYYPYDYPNYGSYYPYYGGYPYGVYGASSLGYDRGYVDSYADPVTSYNSVYTSPIPPPISYQASYASASLAPDTTKAHLTVNVPASAGVWIGGIKMKTPGAVREYESPPLAPGSHYAYEITARWIDNGRLVTQNQEVHVTAGEHINVDFPVALTKAAVTPSAKQN